MLKTNSNKILPSFFLLLFSAASIFAQSSAILSGTVTDENDAVVAGATVKVKNTTNGFERIVTTNDNGTFIIPLLPPSTYVVTIERAGFAPFETRDIVLNVNDHRALNVKLKVGKVGANVTVTNEASLIDESPSVSTVVDRQFVENIPLNGRSFQSLITLTPGVLTVPGGEAGSQGEFSVNGQRTEANYYTVDGVSANTGTSPNAFIPGASGSLPGGTALGTTQSLVSIDALQEFRVETSTYSAESGRTPGGQFAFITRSGTNDWHGSAFDYFRNEVFDANNWFNNANGLSKPPLRQNDFGGTLGGPVLIPSIYNGKNRTFFFFSYEGLRLRTPQPAQNTQVPSLSLRQTAPAALQPFLNSFPIPNGADLGNGLAVFTATYSNPSSLDATSIRIDHSFGDKFNIFGRYSNAPSESASRTSKNLANLSTAVANIKTLTLGATNVFSSRLTNELRANVTWNDGILSNTGDTFGGAVPLDLNHLTGANGQTVSGLDRLIFTLGFGTFPATTLFNYATAQSQFNLIDKLHVTLNQHTLVMGIDYRRLSTPFQKSKLGETVFFRNQAKVLQNAPATFLLFSDSLVPLEPIYTNFSAFAQDEWKVTRRLNLSLGLRWELNPPPSDAGGNMPYTLTQISDLATTQLAPQGTPLWKTTYGNFAPRLGAAYVLRQQSGQEMVLRGGFGVYYDLGNTFASRGYGGIGYYTNRSLSGIAFPVIPSQYPLPPASIAPPYNNAVYAFDPHLKLPYTLQWNISTEQALGANQTLTVSYVGAAARRLLVTQYFFPGILGNPSFSSLAGITTNRATSNYNALQVQFQRRLSRGLQALASYTWSHSIDEASTNAFLFDLLRGNSDFDVRHNFQAAATYNIPGKYKNSLANAVLRHWVLDTRISARSALPFDVISGYTIDPTGTFQNTRADLVPGVPVYVNDPTAPGGRVVNIDAFTQPATGFGNAPRNFLRGFNAWQVDFAVRREFPLGERLKLQFRAEAFNIFNHPNFGAIDNFLSSGPGFFGRSTDTLNNQLGGLNALYQIGGPRSLQFALKLVF